MKDGPTVIIEKGPRHMGYNSIATHVSWVG